MLIMLKEVTQQGDLRDRTINPNHVAQIESGYDDIINRDVSWIIMADGSQIKVLGNVTEITKRLSPAKKILQG